MKSNFFIQSFLLLVGFLSSNAQVVDFKKEFVVVDEKNCFKFKNDLTMGWGYTYIYDIETEEEVISLYYSDNETPSYKDDDYYKIYFSKSTKFLEMSNVMTKKKIFKMLIENKVITPECKIDEEKIDGFIAKYDQNITNRTVR